MQAAKIVDDTYLRGWPLPLAAADGDKDEKGRILLVGGSPEMPGAIMLAAVAAMRAGAGKLTVATAATVAPLVAAQVPEAKVIALREDTDCLLAPGAILEKLGDLADKFDAVVIGPGFETSPALLADIASLLPKFKQAKVILDACAMDAVAGKNCVFPPGDPRPPILLTPHAGEMAHLAGCSKDAVLADPVALLHDGVARWHAVVALKGAVTLVANPQGDLWEHHSATPGLGVSGSGDTLAGIIGGLAARGASLEQACVWGVALHARAGDALAQKMGPLGYLARELAEEIPRLMHGLAADNPAI